ncbi:MAG: ABC transporter ATP-binding protein [Saprospiraceae bacterium]
MIEVKGLYKSFDENHVLKDINMSFQKGKVNFIIGQSGSGKSVLAKCLVGLFEPTKGKVFYDGKDFTGMKRKERTEVRKEIGMLFQGSALFDSLTVEQNIAFPLQMFTKMNKKEMLERVNFCLAKVNLVGKNNLFPAEISGGMQKRVGIARAIAMNPKYLFCDEPNSGLDPKTAIVIDNLIKELTYEFDITTIVISHDMNSVIEAGDLINYIHTGQLWWSGTKSDILKTDNLELQEFIYASDLMKRIKNSLV